MDDPWTLPLSLRSPSERLRTEENVIIPLLLAKLGERGGMGR
jgi:hypothetical protein